MFENRSTIEFRCPTVILDTIIWQNNVNVFMNILLYSKIIDFDDDIVKSRK